MESLHNSGIMCYVKNRIPAIKSPYKAMYRAVQEYSVGSDPSAVPAAMARYLAEAPPSPCGNLKEAFLKVPTATIAKLHGKPVS